MTALFERLRQLNLPAGDFAVFGSGPLIVRGWIEVDNDIDVICRGNAWKRACEAGKLSYNAEYGVQLATLCGGQISFGTRWAIGEFDVPTLIEEAELLDDLPFVRLEHVVAYKKLRASRKDIDHLNAISRNSIAVAGE